MKKSKFLMSVIVGIILITAIITGLSTILESVKPDSVFTSAHSEQEYNKLNRTIQEKNAELIKDMVADPRVTIDIACGALFRFIAANKDPRERESAKRYISGNLGIQNPVDVEIILTRAEQYINVSNQI